MIHMWTPNEPEHKYKLKQHRETKEWRVWNKTRKTFIGGTYKNKEDAQKRIQELKRGK